MGYIKQKEYTKHRYELITELSYYIAKKCEYGDYTKETLATLNCVGAIQTEQLFLQAMETFKSGIVPTDFEEREEVVDELYCKKTIQ